MGNAWFINVTTVFLVANSIHSRLCAHDAVDVRTAVVRFNRCKHARSSDRADMLFLRRAGNAGSDLYFGVSQRTGHLRPIQARVNEACA
jgi:hypothetical protein